MNKEEKKAYDRKRYLDNKEKIKAKVKAYESLDPERWKDYRRDWNLRKKYGIRLEDFRIKKIEQNNLCPICQQRLSEGWDVHVDHDHSTGKFRAILCQPCNVALGLFRDDPERMERAARYVRNHAPSSN